MTRLLGAIAYVLTLSASVTLEQPAPTDAAICDGLMSTAHNAAMRPLAQARIDAYASASSSLFLRGCMLMADDKSDKAIDQFEALVKKDSTRSLYFDWLGRALGDQAQRANKLRQPFLAKRTKAAFERAVALDGNNLEARNYLYQYYIMAPGFMGGSDEKALQQVDAIRARNSYRGGFASANMKFRKQDYAGAEREMLALMKQYPDSTAPYTNAFNHQLTQKHWSDAFHTTDLLRVQHPDARYVEYMVGRAAMLSGEQLERGEAALRRYLTLTPRDNEPTLAVAHMRLGQLLQKRGDNARARLELQEALKLNPKLDEAKQSLAAIK